MFSWPLSALYRPPSFADVKQVTTHSLPPLFALFLQNTPLIIFSFSFPYASPAIHTRIHYLQISSYFLILSSSSLLQTTSPPTLIIYLVDSRVVRLDDRTVGTLREQYKADVSGAPNPYYLQKKKSEQELRKLGYKFVLTRKAQKWDFRPVWTPLWNNGISSGCICSIDI